MDGQTKWKQYTPNNFVVWGGYDETRPYLLHSDLIIIPAKWFWNFVSMSHFWHNLTWYISFSVFVCNPYSHNAHIACPWINQWSSKKKFTIQTECQFPFRPKAGSISVHLTCPVKGTGAWWVKQGSLIWPAELSAPITSITATDRCPTARAPIQLAGHNNVFLLIMDHL